MGEQFVSCEAVSKQIKRHWHVLHVSLCCQLFGWLLGLVSWNVDIFHGPLNTKDEGTMFL